MLKKGLKDKTTGTKRQGPKGPKGPKGQNDNELCSFFPLVLLSLSFCLLGPFGPFGPCLFVPVLLSFCPLLIGRYMEGDQVYVH